MLTLEGSADGCVFVGIRELGDHGVDPFVDLRAAEQPIRRLPIPGEPYGFGTLHRAEALGDYRALVDKQRRVLRAHVRGDVEAGIQHLTDCVRSALASVAAAPMDAR